MFLCGCIRERSDNHNKQCIFYLFAFFFLIKTFCSNYNMVYNIIHTTIIGIRNLCGFSGVRIEFCFWQVIHYVPENWENKFKFLKFLALFITHRVKRVAANTFLYFGQINIWFQVLPNNNTRVQVQLPWRVPLKCGTKCYGKKR